MKKRLCRVLTFNEMQFGLMHEKETIDVVFIVRRLQEEYGGRGNKLFCGPIEGS